MNVQNQEHPSIKVLVTGISGSGKTTLLEKLLVRELQKIARTGKRFWIFIFDHKDRDFERRCKTNPCYTKDELNAAVARGGLVLFNPAKLFPGRRAEGFLWFCDYVWKVKSVLRGPKFLITDELDALVDARSEPEALCEIMDEGRTYEIDCYFICQATNGIHNQVRKQFTEIFVMIQGDKNGLTWLCADCGFNEVEIKALKHGQWLYKNKNTGQAASGGKSFTPKNAVRDLRGL
jgi:hypothetical protein